MIDLDGFLEMHCTSGHVLIDKTFHQVAYCAQNPCTTFMRHLQGV
jgi:hypothetical protein